MNQFLRFGIVGVVGLLVDLAVLHLAAPWLGWYPGRVLSFWAAASTTWWCNRRFTFAASAAPAGAGATGREYLRYLASMCGGAVLNYGAYVLVLWWLGDTPLAATLGVVAGSLAGMLLNFTLAQRVVFRPPQPPRG